MPDFSDFLPVAANNSNVDIAGSVHTAPDPSLNLPDTNLHGDPNATSGFDQYLGTPSLEDKMRATPFDWEKSQADRYVQNKHFANLGFNPYSVPETIDGKTYSGNELKYAGVQTWGEVMSNAIGGGWGLAKNTFVEGWKGWSNVGNALFNWGSDESFMQRLAGSPEDLIEKDNEQKAIFNKYAIFHSPVKDTGLGVFNRELIGDMIQQGGFSIGAGAQFLSEMLLTAGISEGLSSVAKGAGWLAKGTGTAAELAEGIDIAERSKQLYSTGQQINAARMASDPTSIKGFANNLWDYTKQVAGWVGEQYDVVGGIDKLNQARKAGASTYQLMAMGTGGITRFAAALNSAATESRFEAANTYGQLYGDLLQEYQDTHNGEMPSGKDLERIKNTAYSAGVDNFGANTALLMTMNQLEFGNIMSKFGSSSRLYREAAENAGGELFTVTGKLRRDIAGEVEGAGLKEGQKATQAYMKGRLGTTSVFNTIRKDFGLGTALWQVVKRSPATKLELAEGIQEILQNASDNTFRDYYTNLYHGGKDIEGNSILKDITAADWSKGLQSQLSMEGWQTFLMGAATGLFISPIQSAAMGGFKKGQEKFDSQYRDQVNAHKELMKDNLNILNTWYRDPKKALNEHINGIKVQGQADKNLQQALQDNDKYEFFNAKGDAFAKAVAVSIKTGNYESFVSSLQEFGDRMTDEEFEQAFGLKSTTENKVNAKEFTRKIVKDIERYHDNWENLKDKYAGIIQPELYKHSPEDYQRARVAKRALDEVIEMLATTSHHATTTIERALEIRAKIATIPGIGTSANKSWDNLTNPRNTHEELGRLNEELKNLQGLTKDAVISSQIANIKEQIKHLKQWQDGYSLLEGIRTKNVKAVPETEGKFNAYKIQEQLKRAHLGYLTAVNAQYNKETPVINHQQTTEIFNGLMDYNALYRDHGHYVEALNVLTTPENLYRLYKKTEDGIDHGTSVLHTDHVEEVAKRTEAVTGKGVEEETVESFVDRIVSGEDMSDPEDQQFYQNNKEEVEAELIQRQAATVTQETAQPEVTTEEPIEQIPNEVNEEPEQPVEVVTPKLLQDKILAYYNSGKKKGNTKAVKDWLSANPDTKRILDIIYRNKGWDSDRKATEYEAIVRSQVPEENSLAVPKVVEEPVVVEKVALVTNNSELPTPEPRIDFDAAWADDTLWEQLVPEGAKLTPDERRAKYIGTNGRPYLPTAINNAYRELSKQQRSNAVVAISPDNIYDEISLSIHKNATGAVEPYRMELVANGTSLGFISNKAPNALTSMLAQMLGNKEQLVLSGTELEKVLKISIGRGTLNLVRKGEQGLPLEQLNYNTVNGKLVVIDNSDFANGAFLSGSEEDVPQEIATDQSKFKGMYSAAIQFPDGHSYWVQLSPRPLSDEEVNNTIAAINEQAFIASQGSDADIAEVNKKLASIFPALDVFRNDTTTSKGLKIYLRLDPGNPEKGIAGGNKLGVTVVYRPTPFEKGTTVFAAIKQPEGGPVNFEDIDDLLTRVNAAIDDINSQDKGIVPVPHITRANLKEQIPFNPTKDVIMRMLTNIRTPDVVTNVKIGLNVATDAPVISEQANEVPVEVTTHKSVIGNGLVNDTPIPTIPTRFEDMPSDIPDLSTAEGRKAYQRQLRAQSKPSASKIVRSSDIFGTQSIENIDKFNNWVTSNLPGVITVKDLGTLTRNLQDNKVQIGQFVGYLDKLQQPKGTINVYADTPYKYHEAFHAVFRLLLTQQQQDNLYAEARKEFPVTDKALEELRILEPANEHLSRKQLEELYLEERMADKFDSWKMKQSTPVPFGIGNFFSRLWNFIKGLFTKMDKSLMLTMFRDIDSGQYKNSAIQSNQFTEQLTNDPFTFTIPASKIIKVGTQEVTLADGHKVQIDKHLPQQEADRLVSTITALFDKQVRESNLSQYNTNAILDKILDNYRDTYDMEQVDYDSRIDAIPSNDARADYMRRLENLYTTFSTRATRDSIREAVATSLKIIGYKATLEQDALDIITNEYGPRTSDNFDKNDGTMAGPEGKAKELRKFIAGTTTPIVDEFGNTHYADGTPIVEAVNASNVYNGLLKVLANESDMDKQLQKLLQFRRINSDAEGNILTNKATVATINRFLEYTGYNDSTKEFTKNQEMVNLFLKGFSSYAANYLFTQVNNNGRYVVTYANTKDAAKVQTDQWAQAFANGYGKKLFAEDTNEGYKKLYNDNSRPITLFRNALNLTGKEEAISDTKLQKLSQEISNLLKANFGINLHPKYIEYSIIAGKDENVLTDEQRDYKGSFSSTVPIDPQELDRNLTSALAAGKSPYEKGEDNTLMNYLLGLAEQNSIFDETVGTMSFTNSAGDVRYAHTFPNFYHTAITELNNPEVISELEKDPDTANDFLLGSKDFRYLADKKMLKVDITEGLRPEDEQEGVTYDGFNQREMIAYLLGMYDISRQKDAKVVTGTGADDFFYRTRHLIRTVEAKKTGYMVNLPVIQSAVTTGKNTHLSKRALDILYGMVTDEVARINRVQQEIGTPGTKLIEGYHTGNKDNPDQLRGLKLFNTKLMLGDLAQDIEDDPTKELNEKAIKEQINKYWQQKVDELKEMMVSEGLIREDGSNILAPNYLWKGFTDNTGVPDDARNRGMGIIAGNFTHNLTQVMVNDFLNTTGINQLIHGDEAKSFKFFTDQVKRAAGANAAGPSIESAVTRPDWGIEHELHTIHQVTYRDTEFTKRNGKEGQQDDGQMYATIKGFRYMLFGLGTLTQVQAQMMDKIARGEKVTPAEFFKAGGIQDMKAALNPMKMVYFDGNTYLKCSVMPLAKELTSYKVGNRWYPRPGMEEKHLLREKMEVFENTNQTIAFAAPESVSKAMKSNIADNITGINDSHFNALSAANMRQQVENPSGKVTITDPTQKLQQIFAEIPADSKVYYNGKWYQGKGTEELHPIVDKYLDLVAQRLRNSYTQRRNSIFDIKDVFNEIGTSFKQGQVTPKLTAFYDSAYDNLLATGADSQTLEFFRTKDGEIVYDLNFPATLQKYTQLFLSYFSNGVLAAKTPGLTLTVISNAHHKMVKRLISVDKLGQPKEWEVVTNEEFDKDPGKYTTNLIRYSDEGKRTFSGLKEKLQSGEHVYYLDDLRDNVGIYDGRGKRTGTYTEYLTAGHYKETDDSAVEEGVATRIPADDKHSYANVRRVDKLPIWMGSTGMFPQEIMEKNGMDFDLDKLFVNIPDTYRIANTRVAYGTATTPEEQFGEYIIYQMNNNPEFKALYYGDRLFSADEVLDTLLGNEVQLKRAQSILKELKMPSTVAEFTKVGGTTINNGVINNQLLNVNRALMSSEALTGGDEPIINQPTSTAAFDDLTRTLPQLLKGATSEYATNLIDRLQEQRKDTNSIIGKVVSFDVNSQGRDNIGAAANAVINYSINNTFKVPIKGPKLILDGKEYDSYGNYRAWDGNSYTGQRVFAALSAVENAMTDNAKYSYSGKFGLSIGAVGYLSNMLAQGVPFETAMLFILQPTVQEYLKRIGNLQGSLRSDDEKKALKSNIIKEYRKEIEEMFLLSGDPEVAGYANADTNIDRDYLISRIKSGNESLEVLDMLSIIDKQSTDLMDMSRVLKITQGLPTSWEDFDSIKRAMDKFGLLDPSTKEGGLTIDIDKVLGADHKFMAEYIKVFKEIDTLSRYMFLERTPEFNRLKSVVTSNFSVPGINRKVFDKRLKDNLVSYMSIKAYMHHLNQTKLGDYTQSLNHAMIYEEAKARYTDYRDILDIVEDINKKLEGKESNYMVKYFLNQQGSGFTQDGLNKLDSNSWARLSEYQQERLIDSYVSLYTNPDTHLDAVALFHYLLVKDGGQFKNGSFIRYIANGVFKYLLDQSAKVNKLLSQDTIDDKQYQDVFGASSNEVIDEFLKSYTTHINNLDNLRKVSPGYTEDSVVYKVGDSVDIDLFRGYDSKADKETRKDKMDQNMKSLGYSGFTTESSEKGTQRVHQVVFPYSVKVNNQLYVLDNVDGKPNTTAFIGTGDNAAKGTKATYILAAPRGSIGQWEGAGVFGQIPVLDYNILPKDRKSTVSPYAKDVPTGKETVVTEQRGYKPSDIKYPSTVAAIDDLRLLHSVDIAMTKDGWVAGKIGDIMIPISTPEKLLEFMNNSGENTMTYGPDVVSSRDMKEYTNYSGGAQGGDTIWEQIGKEFGLGKQVNYRPEDMNKLTPEQKQEVESAYQKAVKDLGRNTLAANTFAGGLVRRDYLQAKAADSVYAISAIVEPGGKDKKGYTNKTSRQIVEGGTGYAVQMAINLGKTVYVYDQNKGQWFQWNEGFGKFMPTDTPVLTQKFAGIGTREINERGKLAIRDVYEKTTGTHKDIVSSQPTDEQVDKGLQNCGLI